MTYTLYYCYIVYMTYVNLTYIHNWPHPNPDLKLIVPNRLIVTRMITWPCRWLTWSLTSRRWRSAIVSTTPYLLILTLCIHISYNFTAPIPSLSMHTYVHAIYALHPNLSPYSYLIYRRSAESGGLHQLPPDPPGPVEGRLDYERHWRARCLRWSECVVYVYIYFFVRIDVYILCIRCALIHIYCIYPCMCL